MCIVIQSEPTDTDEEIEAAFKEDDKVTFSTHSEHNESQQRDSTLPCM